MTRFLLDANVLSELRRPRPNQGVVSWIDTVDQGEMFVSVLTLGELRYGVERLRPRDHAQADALQRWLNDLMANFGARTVGVDAATSDEWGRLRARRPVDVVDGLLAATALLHGWTLVTRNVRDVEQTGCAVLNPFT